MKRIIYKILEWLKQPKLDRRGYIERLAEKKFNIVNDGSCSYITYDNVRITDGKQFDSYLVELMFTLRKQFVEDNLK